MGGLSRLERAYVYALHGFAVEVCYTALWYAVERGDQRLHGYTSIWSAPIYSICCLGLELLSNRLSGLWWPLRGCLFVLWIYAWEFSTGFLLTSLGIVSWDYAPYFNYHLYGLVTLEYAPLWFATAMAFEQILYPYVLRLRVTPLTRKHH